MKVVRITDTAELPVRTLINKGHHNVKHGMKAPGFVAVQLGVSDDILDASEQKTPAVLSDDNYVLMPIFRGNEHKVDGRGNHLYYIAEDVDSTSADGVIVLWDIPNLKYTNVEYVISGNVDELAVGSSGKIRSGTKYSSPSPLLEITGNATLRWSGIAGDEMYSQTIIYNKVTGWTFGDILMKIKEEA